MEASGSLLRSLHGFSYGGFDNNPLKSSVSGVSIDAGKRFSGEIRLLGCRDSSISLRPSKFSQVFVPRFLDNRHLNYYASPATCSSVCKREKSETATIKKKLKQIKGLTKKLLVLSSEFTSPENDVAFVGDDKRTIMEETGVLLAQLKQLRAEEKELKRKSKEEKAKMKAKSMKAMDDSESSSSSSSESSDSECEQVVNMKHLRNRVLAEPQSIIEEAFLRTNNLPTEEQRIAEVNEDPNLKSFWNLDCMDEVRSVVVEASADINHQRNRVLAEPQSIIEEALLRTTNLPTEEQRIAEANEGPNLKSFWNLDRKGEGRSVVVESSAQKIEVCMGGKCKKLGSASLLEEFQKRVGVEGAVVGCKCMGKCRDGPNVRVSGGLESTVRPATNPLCLGVGLENVGEIVANFLGDGSKDLGLMAT
ncbi:hypothetical protein NE237_028602 [Protea cynaroides]|uniref:Uncharacterized protein n=1 Tax=Protea cynaroides TaxID=273540 RepID=A0A9Q0JVA7_9MAGN|nr:hypothetical protein NE237_028602 [Protea cynaroides]